MGRTQIEERKSGAEIKKRGDAMNAPAASSETGI
jgi:hypothetical protein